MNTDNHVKAVYSVCILTYFINKYLANQRKMICEKDFLNSKQLYAPFKDIDIALLEDSNTGQVVKRSVELPYDTKELLNKLGMTHLVYTED